MHSDWNQYWNTYWSHNGILALHLRKYSCAQFEWVSPDLFSFPARQIVKMEIYVNVAFFQHNIIRVWISSEISIFPLCAKIAKMNEQNYHTSSKLSGSSYLWQTNLLWRSYIWRTSWIALKTTTRQRESSPIFVKRFLQRKLMKCRTSQFPSRWLRVVWTIWTRETCLVAKQHGSDIRVMPWIVP